MALMRDLRDPGKDVDLDRSRLVVDVAQTIINSGKLEVQALRLGARGGAGTGFLPVGSAEDEDEENLSPALKKRLAESRRRDGSAGN